VDARAKRGHDGGEAVPFCDALTIVDRVS